MSQAAGQSVALACQAMGTRFELLLPCVLEEQTARQRSAGESAIEEVRRWHELLTVFEPASIISRINREAAARPVLIPSEIAELLRWCKETSEKTGGAFDPSIGVLMRAAGFRDGSRDPGQLRPVPPAMSGVTLEEGDGAWRVRLTDPRIALDFGAVGKGWALDRGAQLLREQGVERALLHGGTSSVVTVGDSGNGPWRISTGSGPEVGPLLLVDQSLGISAPSGRTVQDERGEQHGHVLDPRTGRSADGVQCAVVGGPLCAVCDAWSTALLVDPALVTSPTWPRGYGAMIFQQPHGWRVYDTSGRPIQEQSRPVRGSVH